MTLLEVFYDEICDRLGQASENSSGEIDAASDVMSITRQLVDLGDLHAETGYMLWKETLGRSAQEVSRDLSAFPGEFQ